jgi:DNA-binding CsgD family transcriptional regulator
VKDLSVIQGTSFRSAHASDTVLVHSPPAAAGASRLDLSDRREERGALDRLLASARGRAGGSLVLRGEPGTGKTSLLEYVIERAADLRVAQVTGVQPEMELGFAALHQLLIPFLSHLDRLPGPQRRALGTAFGLVTAAAPDRFLVSMAVLTLLAEAAVDQPLLVAVDDAQWLDEETAGVLAFVARRLRAVPVAFAIAVREPAARGQSLDGLPYLHLPPIPKRRPSASAGSALVRPTDEAAMAETRPELQPVEPEHARQALLDALHAGRIVGGLARYDTLLDAVRAARTWRTGPQSQPAMIDLLLDGFVTRLTTGYPAGCAPANCPLAADCRHAHRSGVSASSLSSPRPDSRAQAAPIPRAMVIGLPANGSTADPLTSVVRAMGCWAAGELLDSSTRHTLAYRLERTTPDQNDRADATLPAGIIPLGPLGGPGSGELLTLAWRGKETEAGSVAVEHVRDWTRAGLGAGVALAHYALTILDLGLSRYEAALNSALKVYRDDPPDLGTWILPDLIEAATRLGNRDAAASALQRLSERAVACGSHLTSGVLARSRALLTDDDPECLYREAIEHLQQSGSGVHLARTHLLYGEWLRRQYRRRDARKQLRAAYELFDDMGFGAFAHRASVELHATGESGRKRTDDAHDQLTPQEEQITGLVVEGLSNRQVAARLFISRNTVEYHLKKIFRKIGVRSRTQLAHALQDQPRGGGTAVSIR